MNQRQGAFSLADAFKSFSKTATGSLSAVYTVPTANEGAVPPILPTTAIIKSIRLSNQSGGAVVTTVSILDYDASSPLDIEVFKESLADGAESEILTQPIILEQQDAVKILGNGVKILVSLMEIS
mgnify:FL=1